MSDLYIDPVKGSASASGSAANPFKTWAQVNPLLIAGTTVYAAAGVYSDVPVFGASGTAANPIRIIGASKDNCILTRAVSFRGRQHIQISTLRIHIKTTGWFTMDKLSEGISFDQIRLTCEYVEGASLPYVGGLFLGKNHRFTRSSIEGWLHGDAIELTSDYTLFEDIDCSKCDSPHGVFAIMGSHNIIRGSDRQHKMKITNRWDRAFDVMRFGDKGMGVENLFENLHIYQCNYDGSYTLKPGVWPGNHPGTVQICKIGGDGNIYREVDFEICYMAPIATYDYTAVNQVGNFMGGQGSVYLSDNFRNQRFYKVRYLNNELNAISFTVNAAVAHDYSNNHWFNCEFRGNRRALWVQGGIGEGEMPVVHNSVVADGVCVAKQEMTMAEYEAKYPKLAWANTDGKTAPVLAPLTLVAQATTNATVINVKDARPIFDGKGLIAGDVLVIGANPPTAVRRKVTPTQIEMVAPLTVAVGDAVWLDYWIDKPIPPPDPEPDPDPDPTPEPEPVPGAGVTFNVEGTVTVERVDDDEEDVEEL